MPASFVVNTNADTADAHPGDGMALDSNNKTSLRAAVQEANALRTNGGDASSTIEFDQSMTVTLTGPMDPFTANIEVDYIVASPPQIGGGPPPPAPAPVVIQGSGTFRLFRIGDISTSSFSGPFEITGGAANAEGGAFYVESSTSLSLTDCIIFGNSATQNGGAIVNYGSLAIADCDLHENTAGGTGGALANEDGATATIACGSEIFSNTARYGAGIQVDADSTVSVYDGSKIHDNSASMEGGGVYNKGTFTMSGGAIYSNHANGEIFMGRQTGGNGGGVYNDGANHEVGDVNGSVDLTSVLIDGNTAAVSGGGLYLNSTSYTTLSGCTIQNNTGVAAPGIAFEMGASLTGTDTCTFGDPNQEPTQV